MKSLAQTTLAVALTAAAVGCTTNQKTGEIVLHPTLQEGINDATDTVVKTYNTTRDVGIDTYNAFTTPEQQTVLDTANGMTDPDEQAVYINQKTGLSLSDVFAKRKECDGNIVLTGGKDRTYALDCAPKQK